MSDEPWKFFAYTGNAYFYRLTEIKEPQAVCDERMGGEIYSSLSQDAGCLATWSWREWRITKIWGSACYFFLLPRVSI